MELDLSRILGLDLGQRRIGMALSDPLRLTAQGLPTLERQGRGQDLADLGALARRHEIGMWLLGLPRHMSGAEGAQAQAARRFGSALARHTGIRLVYWDERLTTVEADRVLRQAGSSLAQRRRAIDQMSAVILLQSYLDHEAILAAAQDLPAILE